MALTAELVARVERTEPDPGPEPGATEHTPAEFAAMATDFLSQSQQDDLWVFAYGSLIWNPEFEFTESLRARTEEWHRAFCLRLTRWRGTRKFPALMLALDQGGSCEGIAYRLPKHDHLGQITRLLEREIDANPPTNVPRWINVDAGRGAIQAMAFVAEPTGAAYVGQQTPEQVAYVLARAAGHWGSSAQYLYRTVSQLEEHGIHDPQMWRVQELTAREIEDMTRATAALSGGKPPELSSIP